MKLISNAFSKLTSELDEKYFPDLKFYRDDDRCAALHYAVECFSNGVITYFQFIKRLAVNCMDSQENIHKIVSKYVEDWGGYNFVPNQNGFYSLFQDGAVMATGMNSTTRRECLVAGADYFFNDLHSEDPIDTETATEEEMEGRLNGINVFVDDHEEPLEDSYFDNED